MALFKKSGFDFDQYYKEQEREEKKRADSLNNVMKKKRKSDDISYQTSTNTSATENATKQFGNGELHDGEQVLATFRPRHNYAVKLAVLVPLPFMLFWGMIDIGALVGITIGVISGSMPPFILGIIFPFMAVHMFPVWFWLYSIFKAKKLEEYTYYVVTNERIIVTTKSRKADSLHVEESVTRSSLLAMAINQTQKEKDKNIGGIYVFGKKGMLELKNVDNPEKVLQEIYSIIGNANKIEYIYDTSVDLEPYIRRSKYWFYGEFKDEDDDSEQDDQQSTTKTNVGEMYGDVMTRSDQLIKRAEALKKELQEKKSKTDKI